MAKKKPRFTVESPSLTVLIKLGSIAVHADELFSPDGRNADKMALLPLLADSEVAEWVKAMGAMLPLKRVR